MNRTYTNIELFDYIKGQMNEWKGSISAHIKFILDCYGEDNSINVEDLQGYAHNNKFLDTEIILLDGVFLERVYIGKKGKYRGKIVLECCNVRTLNPNNRAVNHVLDNSISLDVYMQVFELLCVYEKIEREKLEKSK